MDRGTDLNNNEKPAKLSLNYTTDWKFYLWVIRQPTVANAVTFSIELHSERFSPVYEYAPFLSLRPGHVFCSHDEVSLLLFVPVSVLHFSAAAAAPLW